MIAAGNDDLFGRLCGCLGWPELAEAERYRTPPNRVRNRESLHQVIEEKLRTDSTEAWIARITDAGVPVGPVNTLDQAVAHPVTAGRGVLIEPQGAGDFPGLRLVRLPFDDARPPVLTLPPRLGEHSEEILSEAGFSQDEIERLLGGRARA
jgi:crotonobetainyl-CoA:carnitine CoA-transferase CaiB-like acyl-CoA transferase